MITRLFISLLITTSLFLPLSPALALFQFNPNYIISDRELFDYQSMGLKEIQAFLERMPGTLKNYQALDIDGMTRGAAEVIYRSSQTYQINPQYLVTLLQKEQSLIENPNPTQYNYDWATGFARCDDCDPIDPRIQIFKGFAKQVERAAWRNRYYVSHREEFRFRIGQPYDVDGTLVIPLNQATVNLYNYTPHLHGNINFWKIWNRYFAKIYPDGTLLQEEGKPGIWLIQNNKRRPFISKAALLSRYDIRLVIPVSKNNLERYEIGRPIQFANYSLLRSPGGTVYLLVNETRRGILNKELFKKIGFHPEEIINVEWTDLKNYLEGEPITLESIYPTGVLLQDKKTGGVWYLENGGRQAIWSKEILKSRFKNKPVIATLGSELEKYPLGEPVKFKDGELVAVKNSSVHKSVYVISQGYKRPFASSQAFQELKYKWQNVVWTDDKSLSLHLDGEPIDVVPVNGAEQGVQ